MLAYYHYPFLSNGNFKEYTEEDLKNPTKVEELFNYCQILEAYITKSGWEFLIQFYGYRKLHEIDKKSGWLSERCDNSDNMEEYMGWVKHEAQNAVE